MRDTTSKTYGKIGSSSSRRGFSWSLSALELYTLIILGLCLLDPIHSFSTSNAPNDPTNNMAQENPMKVLVTGAAGQTGRLVLKKLEEDCRYDPKGLVRTERSAIKLIKGDVHCPLEHMIVSDVTSPTFEEDISSGLDGLDAMVICTSAVPRIRRGSLVLALLSAPWNMIRRRKAVDFRNFQFKWKHNGYPEKVDYHGQIKQIKLAKKLGMKHIVLVSSMGVTDPNHFLNNVGKDKRGNGNGDILLWKRKAEKYLVDSGLDYTIIHPGGLVDAYGTPNAQQKVLLDVDDNLFLDKNLSRTCISREDVAELCVSALNVGRGKKVSFDCIATETQNEVLKTSDETLLEFFDESKTANYSLV